MKENKKHLFRLKRIYQGLSSNSSSSEISRILSIIHLDFVVESILRTIMSSYSKPSDYTLPQHYYYNKVNALKNQKAPAKYEFTRVWDEVTEILNTKKRINLNSLPLRHEIKILHELRNKVAHQGIIPSAEDVIKFNVLVESFLQTLYHEVFKTDFDELNLTALIIDPIIKLEMEKSEKFFRSKNYKKSIVYASVAFEEMISIAEGRFINYRNVTSLNFPQQIESIGRPLEMEFDTVNSKIKKIEEQLFLMSSGLDIKGYHQFRTIAPKATKKWDGKYYVRLYHAAKKRFTKSNSKFVYDYVIDQILKLEESGIKRKEDKQAKTELNVEINEIKYGNVSLV